MTQDMNDLAQLQAEVTALRAENLRLRSDVTPQLLGVLLENDHTGYLVWEREQGVVLFRDRDGERGLSDSSNIDRLFARMPAREREEASERFRRCCEEGEDYEGTYIVDQTETGHRTLHLLARAVVCDKQGAVKRVILTFSDVSHVVEQQQLLRDAWEQANSANRAKSDFLARMSHEICTPMNAVIGMAHLLSGTELTPRQADYLDSISASANDLLRIINDILDFSKIEAGKMDIDKHDFHLDRVIDQMAALFGLDVANKNLEIIYDIKEDVPRNLRGDSERLKQVLVNLIANAVKFTDKGNIILQARVLKTNPEQVVLQFHVVDSGIGLSEKQLQNLFLPFTQADGSTSRRFGGTGLGLSISKRLVELMGGEITVSGCHKIT